MGLKVWSYDYIRLQWTPSNQATLGTGERLASGHISRVVLVLQSMHNIGTSQSGLNTGVALFQGFKLKGIHCSMLNIISTVVHNITLSFGSLSYCSAPGINM